MSQPDNDPVDAYRMPLMEHIRELRHRLFVALGAITVGICVGFAFVDPIWAFLVDPMNAALEENGQGTLAISSLVEGFMTKLKVAALAGVSLACPVLFHQAWGFVAPGLYPKEQRTVLPMVISSTVLFLLGGVFAYTVIFQLAFPFFLQITPEGALPVLSIGDYLGVVTKLIFAFGLCFQLPVIVFFLARIGLVDAHDLIHFFKYAVVSIFVVAALLTPPDVVSQILMAGPLLLLYGVGIILAWMFSTKERTEIE